MLWSNRPCRYHLISWMKALDCNLICPVTNTKNKNSQITSETSLSMCHKCIICLEPIETTTLSSIKFTPKTNRKPVSKINCCSALYHSECLYKYYHHKYSSLQNSSEHTNIIVGCCHCGQNIDKDIIDEIK